MLLLTPESGVFKVHPEAGGIEAIKWPFPLDGERAMARVTNGWFIFQVDASGSSHEECGWISRTAN